MNKTKRIFIVIMLLISTYCSIESCSDEENPSQCQTHSIEISDLSCYTLKKTTKNIVLHFMTNITYKNS